MKTVLLGLALVIVAVSRTVQAQTNAQPLAVRAEPTDSATRLVLVAAPGWKINARVKPALELPSGAIVRFDAPQLTADSAYFAEPPTARILGRVATVRGMLKASVCAVGEQVCRVVTLKL